MEAPDDLILLRKTSHDIGIQAMHTKLVRFPLRQAVLLNINKLSWILVTMLLRCAFQSFQKKEVLELETFIFSRSRLVLKQIQEFVPSLMYSRSKSFQIN